MAKKVCLLLVIFVAILYVVDSSGNSNVKNRTTGVINWKLKNFKSNASQLFFAVSNEKTKEFSFKNATVPYKQFIVVDEIKNRTDSPKVVKLGYNLSGSYLCVSDDGKTYQFENVATNETNPRCEYAEKYDKKTNLYQYQSLFFRCWYLGADSKGNPTPPKDTKENSINSKFQVTNHQLFKRTDDLEV